MPWCSRVESDGTTRSPDFSTTPSAASRSATVPSRVTTVLARPSTETVTSRRGGVPPMTWPATTTSAAVTATTSEVRMSRRRRRSARRRATIAGRFGRSAAYSSGTGHEGSGTASGAGAGVTVPASGAGTAASAGVDSWAGVPSGPGTSAARSKIEIGATTSGSAPVRNGCSVSAVRQKSDSSSASSRSRSSWPSSSWSSSSSPVKSTARSSAVRSIGSQASGSGADWRAGEGCTARSAYRRARVSPTRVARRARYSLIGSASRSGSRTPGGCRNGGEPNDGLLEGQSRYQDLAVPGGRWGGPAVAAPARKATGDGTAGARPPTSGAGEDRLSIC